MYCLLIKLIILVKMYIATPRKTGPNGTAPSSLALIYASLHQKPTLLTLKHLAQGNGNANAKLEG